VEVGESPDARRRTRYAGHMRYPDGTGLDLG
jgi:hypothetical protein